MTCLVVLLILLVCALAGGCIGPAPLPARATPPGVANRAVSDVVVSPAEEKLDKGKNAAMHARWQEAEDAFREVYGDGSARAERRAEALYQLGQLSSNFLNPSRDASQAISWFRRLLDEFPHDNLAPDARARIDELKQSGEPPSPIR